MNKEIKEILERLKYTNNDVMWCDKITLDVEQSHLLLDYITNLQQDYDMAMELIDKGVENSYKMLKDYKSRCEKAIEYIKEAIENDDYFEDDIATDISEPTYDKYVNSSSLLNILQNGSDSE